jgi:putative PIN family toxin of toxin-antitoxin system
VKHGIVLDTNILISGYLWSGKPRQALRLVKSDDFILLYCRGSIDELVRVLSLKFRLSATEIYKIVLDIKSIGKQVLISSKEYPISEDPTDNLFINLALDGNAKTIVSGDSHLLKIEKYRGIVSVSKFLEYYA